MKEFTSLHISSQFLQRPVLIDVYGDIESLKDKQTDLLLFNDGQDLLKMNFHSILKRSIGPTHSMVVLGLHAGIERKQEYGVAGIPDFMNRGAKAFLYSKFVLEELLPHIQTSYFPIRFRNKYVAGFSLGGLMAFDLAMDYPMEFSAAGVFSGSFWWRSKDLNEGYVEERDRIMHAKIRTKCVQPHQRFYFQTGALDEKADRNKNGIIDSIDDALDIIKELEKLGFQKGKQIEYVELPEGKHDIATWKVAIPEFLQWLLTK
ncbi:MAG: hypothetical protein RI965_627 [Bacteroidota bacterium]